MGTGHVSRSIATRGEKRAIEIYGDACEHAVVIVSRPSGIVSRPKWADLIAKEHAGATEPSERQEEKQQHQTRSTTKS